MYILNIKEIWGGDLDMNVMLFRIVVDIAIKVVALLAALALVLLIEHIKIKKD